MWGYGRINEVNGENPFTLHTHTLTTFQCYLSIISYKVEQNILDYWT